MHDDDGRGKDDDDNNNNERLFVYDNWVAQAVEQPLGADAFLGLLTGLPLITDAVLGESVSECVCVCEGSSSC